MSVYLSEQTPAQKGFSLTTHLHVIALILKNNTYCEFLKANKKFCREIMPDYPDTRHENQPCMLHQYLHLCSVVSFPSQAEDEARHIPVSKRNITLEISGGFALSFWYFHQVSVELKN